MEITSLFSLYGVSKNLVLVLCGYSFLITLINGYQVMRSVVSTVIVNFMFIGAVFLAGSNEFVTFFVALEFVSLLTYALVSISEQKRSEEAAVNYFIQGSVMSAVFLLSIAFFFGATGGLSFNTFNILNHELYSVSMVLLSAVMFFKLGCFPFHAWIPDTYSNASKGNLSANFLVNKFVVGSVFILLYQKLLTECEPVVQDLIINSVSIVAVISAFYGNIMGLAQTQFKRVLAYSSIAHAGYMIMVVALSLNEGYENQLIFYMAFYVLAATGALLAINYYQNEGKEVDNYDSLKGAYYKNHFMGLFLAVFVLSLAGIPLTAGFATKYLLFVNFFREGMSAIAISILISSIIGLGYYIKFIMALFMEDSEQLNQALVVKSAKQHLLSKIVFFILGALIIVAGVAPGLFLSK